MACQKSYSCKQKTAIVGVVATETCILPRAPQNGMCNFGPWILFPSVVIATFLHHSHGSNRSWRDDGYSPVSQRPIRVARFARRLRLSSEEKKRRRAVKL